MLRECERLGHVLKPGTQSKDNLSLSLVKLAYGYNYLSITSVLKGPKLHRYQYTSSSDDLVFKYFDL